jgi:hypothetical protein
MIDTVPDSTLTPPPFPDPHPAHQPCTQPPVMLSPITCTTPDEPGLMFSTRRGLEELACAFRMTVAPAAASRMTLLVMLSSAVR